MTPTQLRNRAAHLAERDPSAALEVARGIDDCWFRAQALAHVARYHDEDQSLALAQEALRAAAEASDPFRAVAVAAWPIRAMIERGYQEAAARELSRLLEHAPLIEPDSSRSEALFLLYQASFSLGDDVRVTIARRLLELGNKDDAHWRTKRNLVDALAMLTAPQPSEAHSLAEEITDRKTRARAESALKAPVPASPRAFFWKTSAG